MRREGGGERGREFGLAAFFRRGLILVTALVTVTTGGTAQQRRPPGPALPPAPVMLAVSGGWTRDAAEAFAEDVLCPATDGNSWAARAGFRALGPFILEAVIGYHRGQDEAECINGLVPPVPNVGPYTRESTSFDPKYRGYPFYSTAARAAIELPVGRALRLRGVGGMGVVWEKDLPFRLLGAELLFGRGGRSLFAEAERWWHEVPRQTVIDQYMDGVLVSHTRTTEDVSHRTTLLRVGIEFAMGR